MFLYLSKLVPVFVYPLGLSILLLAVGALTGKKLRLSRIVCLIALALLVVFSSGLVSNALLRSLEDQFPEPDIAALPQAQAIVVLGGGLVPTATREYGELEFANPSSRLPLALTLYRAGKAPVILVTGGNISFLGGTGMAPEAQLAGQLLKVWGVPEKALLIEDASRNTRENATFSARLLNPKGIHRILLVTSAMHMPRAFKVFKKLGFQVTPVAADFQSHGPEPDFLFRCLPDVSSLGASQAAMKEWLGLWTYRMAGWV